MFETGHFTHKWISASRGIPASKQKVMIVLHGRGDSLDAFSQIKNELRLPQFNYLILNAPRKYLTGFSWYTREPAVRDVRKKLFRLVGELLSQGWDAKDIFWMGHSQGALVAADAVMNYPEAFGGIIGVSGYVWFSRGWKKRAENSGAKLTPWLFTHGLRDRVIFPAEIREDIAALAGSHVPVLYKEFAKGHDFDFSSEVPFIRKWIRDRRTRRASFLAGSRLPS